MEALLVDTLIVFLFLILIIVIIYVVFRDSKPEEKLRYENMSKGVFFLPNECGDIVTKKDGQVRHLKLITATKYKNKALQKQVKERVTHTPINTNIRITNYANDIVEDLEFCRLLPQGWEPVFALHYTNSICMIRYKKRLPKDAEEDPDYKDVFFSTVDGHIVHFKPAS